MGELISSKKGTRQREVSKQNLEKPSCIKRGSKKHLVLVDEDDDEDNDISQVDMEPAAGWEDDGNEGYSLRSQGYADQDDAYDDMDANNHNEIQGADSHDDSEGEDDALVQDQLQSPELEKAIEISKTNKRGPTMLHLVHTRKVDEREVIICNKFGQPVGPRTKEKDVVGKFSRFFGTIARNQSYVRMTYSSWHKVPHKDKMWEYVLEKYDVPYAAKTWVLKATGNAYKVHKCRFKKKHFYAYKDNKTRLMNRPKNIPVDDFSQLLRLWSNKDVEKRCLRAKEIRMSQKNMHTAGPISFAIIREEMRNDDPNKELPSLTKVFERTRKRTEGRAYLDTYDDTAMKIEQMKNYKPPEDGSVLVDPFTAVMNKEYDGYLRLYGRGVTKKMMEKMDGKDEPYMIPDGLMESFKADIEGEKTQLLEMRKEIEEEHQRKKAELKAMHKDFDNKQANFEATMRSIMEKLPIEVLQDLRDE
ncbi:putative transposase, Ptta/En/Spm, plant [Helianthus annuus]|nr:putative transposase, Ptta/En/Spm, plant [Helianthus annuus]